MNTENLIIGLALVTIAFICIDLTRTLLSGDKPQRVRRRSAPRSALRVHGAVGHRRTH